MAQIVYRFPVLLDATAREMEKKGDEMMSKWAEVRCVVKLYTYFKKTFFVFLLCRFLCCPVQWNTQNEQNTLSVKTY